ncbi:MULTISPECIES: hypothetical protein [Bacillus]|uniref:Uncharacterized protein n=2 Tax=Bacillus TaxID=1386 RepID=A0A0M4FW98_9BACI|nr:MULTISPECIES: hypothetical protein [Bacillus]ALC83018.1 hypothetical protein AM592_16620 [Bacillus gobiensis]MBP1082043.1 hypothetical protein [Bacillus capparidis]MED1096672.1 hypothetical protein [Bacillus capparidis]
MKKFKMIVTALIVALLVPSSAFASSMKPLGTGSWDYKVKTLNQVEAILGFVFPIIVQKVITIYLKKMHITQTIK